MHVKRTLGPDTFSGMINDTPQTFAHSVRKPRVTRCIVAEFIRSLWEAIVIVDQAWLLVSDNCCLPLL